MASEDRTLKVWIDPNAKSLSYFCRDSQLYLAPGAIDELEKIAEERGKINARICLHNDPKSDLHDMIILEYRDKKCRKPHKHSDKDEILHMLRGKMEVFVFGEEGQLVDRTLLDTEKTFLYRNGRGLYHFWLPATEFAVYRETKQGPFKPGDNIPPAWNYADKLQGYIEQNEVMCKNNSCKGPCSLNIIKWKN